MIQNDELRVNDNRMLLWNMKIPPKVRHFIWRLLLSCLLTCQRLQTKSVLCPCLCAYYDTNIEDD